MLDALCLLCALFADPPLLDRERFPPLEMIHQALEANRAYQRHVELRMAVETRHWWQWHEALAETRQLYECWDWLRDARSCYGERYQRRALARLRELLGPGAYYAGHMPPPVPLWRLQRV